MALALAHEGLFNPHNARVVHPTNVFGGSQSLKARTMYFIRSILGNGRVLCCMHGSSQVEITQRCDVGFKEHHNPFTDQKKLGIFLGVDLNRQFSVKTFRTAAYLNV